MKKMWEGKREGERGDEKRGRKERQDCQEGNQGVFCEKENPTKTQRTSVAFSLPLLPPLLSFLSSNPHSPRQSSSFPQCQHQGKGSQGKREEGRGERRRGKSKRQGKGKRMKRGWKESNKQPLPHTFSCPSTGKKRNQKKPTPPLPSPFLSFPSCLLILPTPLFH